MHIFGIRIRISPSWFVIGAFFALDMASWLSLKHVPDGTAWHCGAFYAVMFGGSVLAHELGHSRVFQHYGGHIEQIQLWALGGIASLTGEPEKPHQEFWVAIAGPAVSIMLAILFGGLTWLFSWLDAPYYLWFIAQRLLILNLVLGLFNMVPLFPLDGGSRLAFAALVAHERHGTCHAFVSSADHRDWFRRQVDVPWHVHLDVPVPVAVVHIHGDLRQRHGQAVRGVDTDAESPGIGLWQAGRARLHR